MNPTDEIITESIARGFSAGIAYVLFMWAIRIAILSGIAALITVIVKKVWNSGNKPNQNQQIHNVGKEGYSGKQRWYPTGWIFNEETQLWEPPDYLSKQTKQKWRWDDEKKIWIDTEKEQRLIRYKEYHKDKPPTFEEWKAEREAQINNEHPEK